VIILDTYERLASLDDWVRTELAPSLPAAALLVIAGRASPGPGWRRDPAWRELLRVISLRNLSPDESRRYLEACGVPAERHDQLVATSHGHPLGLSLLTDVVARGGDVSVDALAPDLVEILVRQFVDVVPSERQRRALGVAALARVTTEALLRDTLGSDDAHELFSWLRELSFMESGAEGLFPHDLARDVLDVDMRWRDPEGYRSTFRAVRAHVHARLAQTRGRAQQRAIFDEKFLFRNLPSVLSPVDWQTWGAHYPEPALPGDRAQILELTERWEGAASAAIAARWLDAQPEGFVVIRRRDHAVSGFLAMIDLSAASADDLEADPGAKAAWNYAQRQAPARPGETVTQARFLIDREAYQAPSPTLNAAPIATIQRQLLTPRLAWDFLTLAEPEPWDAYFEIADLHRAKGWDFVVGGKRYGLFAHDFRKVPVDRWLELVTERALEQDFTLPPPRDSEALVLSQAEFEDAVRQALRHLRDPAPLARSPLLRSGLVRDRANGRAPEPADVQSLLFDAIDGLREASHDDKRFRALKRAFVQDPLTQEAAAEALGLPFSTYRRHLTQGIDKVVAWLWEREVYGS
jgi:hypothetical protein